MASLNYHTAARNLRLFHDLAQALAVLRSAGIQVIVLKGAALAETVYPSLAHRPMSDADLLVSAEQREAASSLLQSAGFIHIPEPREGLRPFDCAFTGNLDFQSPGGFSIELHWELLPVEWLRRMTRLDLQLLWESAQPLEFEGIPVLQLSPIDTLLHICVHLVAHSINHPPGFADIIHLLGHYDPFPWEAFIERARLFRLGPIAYFVLLAASRELSAPVPDRVLAALQPSWLQRQIVPWFISPKSGLTTAITDERNRGYLLHLLLAERLGDFLSVFAWLLFPGLDWLQERYRLSSRYQAWLACLWHPFYVLFQGAMGVFELFSHGHTTKKAAGYFLSDK